MSINISTRMRRRVSPLITALFVIVNTSAMFAHPPAGSTSAQHGDHRHGADDRDARQAARARHGGQVSTTTTYAFEVVYQRNETRVYLYDRSMRPASARGLRGEIVMQVRGNSNLYRYRLDYAAVEPRSGEQDYLVARVDVSRVRDGDMQVSFDLVGLPARSEPAARFTQTFALTATAPIVTVAAVTRDDSAAIARQGKCVVMDTKLGDHGRPIKLLLGKQAIYVCCKGCINKVKKNPEFYLRKAGGRVEAATARPAAATITVAKATAADQRAIRAQGICPVTKVKLGDHGAPLKLTAAGRSLFVCCRGCVGKVKKNPNLYFGKAFR